MAQVLLRVRESRDHRCYDAITASWSVTAVWLLCIAEVWLLDCVGYMSNFNWVLLIESMKCLQSAFPQQQQQHIHDNLIWIQQVHYLWRGLRGQQCGLPPGEPASELWSFSHRGAERRYLSLLSFPGSSCMFNHPSCFNFRAFGNIEILCCIAFWVTRAFWPL